MRIGVGLAFAKPRLEGFTAGALKRRLTAWALPMLASLPKPERSGALMPVVFHWSGYQFYADEGDRCEPVHIHSNKNGANARFWLHPQVSVVYDRGFSRRALAELSTTIGVADRIEGQRPWVILRCGGNHQITWSIPCLLLQVLRILPRKQV
jgi:hypothetical protein